MTATTRTERKRDDSVQVMIVMGLGMMMVCREVVQKKRQCGGYV
jgi:hypothetical protein